jgi:hypothetical protein
VFGLRPFSQLSFTPGGVWDGTVIPVTGVLAFDWFFTMMLLLGLVAVFVVMVLRVVSRS